MRLSVLPHEAELAADALWQLGSSAVHEEPVGEWIVLTADPTDLSGLDDLRVRWDVELLELDVDEHLDAWRRWATPVRAGRRIVLQPAWLPVDGGVDDVVVVLDPGRTFGSGSHPSTRLVLAAIEDRLLDGDEVLDVGTGSGVLAVAACLMGAASAVAIDVAPAAVDVALANARVNGVADRVTASTRPLADVAGTFDVVLANIGAGVLVELAREVVERTRPHGCLVLAGLLAEQVESVVGAFAALGARLVERLDEDGWSALVLEPREQPPSGGPPTG